MRVVKYGVCVACLVAVAGVLAEQPETKTVVIVITKGGADSKYVEKTKYKPGGNNNQEPVVVKVGWKVVWENLDGMAHTATSDKKGIFDTKKIAAKGKSTAKEFTQEMFLKAGGKAGGTVTIPYYCNYHEDMRAEIKLSEK